jgi:hypothetical protein
VVHSYATGGSSDNEHWGPPHRLGDALNANTQESCTTYNILKVARHLHAWTGNASYVDFLERALLNGLVGNQNRAAPFAEVCVWKTPHHPLPDWQWSLGRQPMPDNHPSPRSLRTPETMASGWRPVISEWNEGLAGCPASLCLPLA